jgi:hypothetical protein
MNFRPSVLLASFAILITSFAQSHAGTAPGDPVVWPMKTMLEFEHLVGDISKDVHQFFNDNPDIIADNFGGAAYNFMQSLMEWKHDFRSAARDMLHALLPSLVEGSGKEGADRLCESPRICQGLQYLTAKSIVEHMDSIKTLDFYIGEANDFRHSFIIAMPKGVPMTNENLRIQGLIIDPWPFQTPDPNGFVFPANNPYYQDIFWDTQKLTREKFIEKWKFDPFTTQPQPTPTPTPTVTPTPSPSPTPTAEPTPIPSPTPTIICDPENGCPNPNPTPTPTCNMNYFDTAWMFEHSDPFNSALTVDAVEIHFANPALIGTPTQWAYPNFIVPTCAFPDTGALSVMQTAAASRTDGYTCVGAKFYPAGSKNWGSPPSDISGFDMFWWCAP